MPSKAQVQYKVGLYAEQAEQLERLVKEHDVPSSRILREALMFILGDLDALTFVIEQARKPQYRNTGANVGLWKQAEIKRYQNAKKKSNEESGP